MVDYAGAIKKPFQDLQTLAIGIIIGAVSPFTLGLVGLLITGYSVGIGRNVLKGNNKMPKWDPGQIVQYIKDLIFVIIISIIYMIPAGILLIVGGAALIGTVLSAISGGGGDVGATILGGIATGGIFILLGLLLALVGMLFSTMGIFFYIKEGSLGAAFKFGAILKKILTGSFWATLIILVIYSIVLFIVAGLLSIIPVVGTLVGIGLVTFLSSTTSYTMFAQVFKETP